VGRRTEANSLDHSYKREENNLYLPETIKKPQNRRAQKKYLPCEFPLVEIE